MHTMKLKMIFTWESGSLLEPYLDWVILTGSLFQLEEQI